jgi:hypothetical protein
VLDFDLGEPRVVQDAGKAADKTCIDLFGGSLRTGRHLGILCFVVSAAAQSRPLELLSNRSRRGHGQKRPTGHIGVKPSASSSRQRPGQRRLAKTGTAVL